MSSRDRGHRSYRPTASKYKGGAAEMYVTYDLPQKTRGRREAILPKVKRVYIAGDVLKWKAGGALRKRTGKEVSGVKIDYHRPRGSYDRGSYDAIRGDADYAVKASHVRRADQHFTQVVEVPHKAKNVNFYPSAARLPARYRGALQNVR